MASTPQWLQGQIKQCSIAERKKLSGTREEIAYISSGNTKIHIHAM